MLKLLLSGADGQAVTMPPSHFLICGQVAARVRIPVGALRFLVFDLFYA